MSQGDVSGGGDAFDLDNVVPGIIALDAHPFFHVIDGNAQEHQAERSAQITLEQKSGLVADQPARLVYSSAYLGHEASL